MPTEASGKDARTAVLDSAARVVLPGSRDPRDPSRAIGRGGHGLTRKEVFDRQHTRLIDAVVQVVAERGYDQAGVKTIADRAGVGLNTFYEHYSSKEKLCLAAYDAGVELVFQAVSDAYAAGDHTPWHARLNSGLDALLETFAANPAFARFCTIEMRKAEPAVAARVEQAFDAAYAMFSSAPARPRSALPPADLLPLVVGGIYSRIYRYIRDGNTARLPELRDLFKRFVVATFGEVELDQISLRLEPVRKGKVAGKANRARDPTKGPARQSKAKAGRG